MREGQHDPTCGIWQKDQELDTFRASQMLIKTEMKVLSWKLHETKKKQNEKYENNTSLHEI